MWEQVRGEGMGISRTLPVAGCQLPVKADARCWTLDAGQGVTADGSRKMDRKSRMIGFAIRKDGSKVES